MERRKLTKEDIDKVRDIEGFPIAKDEDIIALSDAPYYTACPNPFIEDFIHKYGTLYDEATDDYHCEPFTSDVSEGKYDPLYKFHPYHTKVPHKAIMRYILHYTKSGDIIFDGFCGTGMTGVAAQMCGNPDPAFKMQIENEMPGIEWGARKAILSDLSPAATFIAYNYNTPIDVEEFRKEAERILAEVEKECGWMYETRHVVDDKQQIMLDSEPQMGRINYTVWSDVFICPTCSEEIVFWDDAVDKPNGKVLDKFTCSHCGRELKKADCLRANESYVDEKLRETVVKAKQLPVFINYSVGNKKYEKKPDEYDFALQDRINATEIPYWFPAVRMCEGSESRRNDKIGITHTHQFYTRRNLYFLAKFNEMCKDRLLKLLLLRVAFRITLRYALTYQNGVWGAGGGPTPGTLFIPSLVKDLPIGKQMASAIKPFCEAISSIRLNGNSIINTQSTTHLNMLPDKSVDYIFTDPPFGGNLNYSELNFIWESWLRVITNSSSEAITNKSHGKELPEYQALMAKCFTEYYRVLKPGRWITVEFHNSQNSVWNIIQEALQREGFVIADIRTLDKKKGNFQQVTTTSAVKQDLVISAYKPKDSFKREFEAKAGSEETAWAFVRQHLANLPVVVVKNNHVEILAERQAFLLFDRMVAYHMMNGISIPLDAADFYKGLDNHFLERDSMYFLPDQVNEYDTARIENDIETVQFELFVTNEKSAIAWLYQQLEQQHQTYAELQPKFMQEVKTIDRFEAIPELSILLDDSFLQDEKGRWYTPDISKAVDIAKLREKRLLKEFEGYLSSKDRLKLFRIEAIRAGFAKLWADKNYELIVKTAERIPDSALQEDEKLLMYYDLSLGRI